MRLAFYVKEMLPWAVALIFLGVAWSFSLWTPTRTGSSQMEQDPAWTILTAITSGAAGILFGKQLGK